MDQHHFFMGLSLEEAQKSALRQEVPVGAVLVSKEGEILAQGGNAMRQSLDPTAHAEMDVIRRASCTLGQWRLDGCTLYVTLEPCAMCAAALSLARVACVVYGAADPKGGGIDHGPRFYQQPTCHHRPQVISGIRQEECGDLLKRFFQERR